jgi:hypothetical protein
MRNFFLVLSLFFIVQTAEAQLFSKERILNNENFDKARWSWGYFLGFNNYDFKFDYINETGQKDIEVQTGGGFNVGLVGNLRINDYLDLRLEPGLYYTERNLIYPDFEEEVDFLREVKSTYIHFPLLLKISTKRLNNFKPFVVAGLSTSINLTGDETNPEDNSVGRFRMTNNTYYYELGFGIDFYLFYFKFTPSIRGVFALTDELVRDFSPSSPYTSNIEKMATRGVFINFTFQ